MNRKLLSKQTIAKLLDVSVQAFSNWGLKPVRREGREAMYDWDEAREMAFRKRLARPGRQGPGLPHTAFELLDRIAQRGLAAVEREDIAGASLHIRMMQELLLMHGIEP